MTGRTRDAGKCAERDKEKLTYKKKERQVKKK